MIFKNLNKNLLKNVENIDYLDSKTINYDIYKDINEQEIDYIKNINKFNNNKINLKKLGKK